MKKSTHSYNSTVSGNRLKQSPTHAHRQWEFLTCCVDNYLDSLYVYKRGKHCVFTAAGSFQEICLVNM